MEKLGNGGCLALWWILSGAEVMVLVCGGNLQAVPRKGALRLYFQLALPRLAEYKGAVARLKSVSS